MCPIRSKLARRLAVALSASLSLVACEGESRPVLPAGAGQGIQVRITPAAPRVRVSGTQAFTASVTGTTDPRVGWMVVEPTGGSIDGTGHYSAPATAATYHVRATSAVDDRAFAEVPVTVVPPLVLGVAPTSAAVDACGTVQLTATVTNVLADATVRWTVQEGAAGGTVSASGLYTAPATGSTYHVVATSAEDATKVVTVPVTVTERVLSVVVSPASVRVQPGQTVQFTSTVQTSCGSTTTATTFTAP